MPLRKLLRKKAPSKQVFNADKSALLWNKMPQRAVTSVRRGSEGWVKAGRGG